MKKIRFRKAVICVGLALILPLLSSAQADFYQGKGRIALSSDGNMHDNDDMQATMLSLAILAKANLQDVTTLYTYADHIWGNEENDIDLMTVAAEETGRRFGFSNTVFIAAVENHETAYNSMCAEILKSTEADPLFIIAAGPMHVVGTAIECANKKNPEALKFVTVISHSDWNNEHSDTPMLTKNYHSDPELPHEGWTWDEMKTTFGDKVNFKRIVDQNGTGVGEEVYRTKDKFNFGYWEKIEWMKNHEDENIKWIYDTAKKNPCGPDFSDAGMLYYLVADLGGVRGDEHGNDVKLKEWMGDSLITKQNHDIKINMSMAGEIVVGDDYIVIEAEATRSPLGKWVVRDVNDPLYNRIKGHPKSIGGKYIEYMGGTIMGRNVEIVKDDVLVYKFTPKTSGNYIFTARMGQRLTTNGKTEREDLCNDIFVKMEGDFESGNEVSKDHLISWQKFYGRGLDKWGGLSRADVEHEKLVYSYALKAGEEYTFKISGRSQRCAIDYMVFVKSPYVYGDYIDIAVNNAIKYRTGIENIGLASYKLTIPSVKFEIKVDEGNGFSDASVDKWRDVLQMPHRLKKGAAEFVYNGPKREVYITLNTMLESDGESKYTVYVDGEKIASVKNKRIFGTDIKDYTIDSIKLSQDAVEIENGDVIRVEFTSATNGRLTDGDHKSASRGRWKSLVLETK